MKLVDFTLKDGKFYAKVDGGPEFFVGKRVTYQGKKGLTNLSSTAAERYSRTDYAATHGYWADYIHPTAMCEGEGSFHCLNTYDRARFTFGFMQYAAHVPDGDFVEYFRRLLALPGALEYFPDLYVDDGRIFRSKDTGDVQLESAVSTDGLMGYLNPSREQVEDVEVIQAAKFVHWVKTDLAHRELQVTTAVEHFRSRMRRYGSQHQLNGKVDAICVVVFDIRHQGRAGLATINQALKANDPLKALLKIGETTYPARIARLRKEITALKTAGVLGMRRYNLATADFG
jgi:hypothetical protein